MGLTSLPFAWSIPSAASRFLWNTAIRYHSRIGDVHGGTAKLLRKRSPVDIVWPIIGLIVFSGFAINRFIKGAPTTTHRYGLFGILETYPYLYLPLIAFCLWWLFEEIRKKPAVMSANPVAPPAFDNVASPPSAYDTPIGVSPGGSKVFRYDNGPAAFEAAFGDEETINKVTQHIERYVGHDDNVYHEIISDAVHIDVHVVNPTSERNYYTLVTSGMSDRPMRAPKGAEAFRYAELVICLPPTWRLDQASLKNEDNYWPLRWLKQLARFPHKYNTWLFAEHTIPNGDPAEPFSPNTKFSCMILSEPTLFHEEFARLTVDKSKTIYFLTLIPIYDSETNYKLQHGAEELLKKLFAAGVTELVDIQRSDAVHLKETQ